MPTLTQVYAIAIVVILLILASIRTQYLIYRLTIKTKSLDSKITSLNSALAASQSVNLDTTYITSHQLTPLSESIQEGVSSGTCKAILPSPLPAPPPPSRYTISEFDLCDQSTRSSQNHLFPYLWKYIPEP